ncbi:MAG: transporter permease [Devosia sp.]|nr:transporter permease [Devosia sp.]
MRNFSAILDKLVPLFVIIAFFIIWELATVLFQIPSFLLPAPSTIFGVMAKSFVPIMGHAGQTLWTTCIGFAFAIAFGLLGGVVLGSSPRLYRAFYPLLIGFNSIPKVAVVPVLVIWFGIGTIPAIISAFLISFFPIMVNVATGIATLEPELKDVLLALGAKRRDIMVKVGIPRSMPYFFASLKIAITLAFVGAIISETVAANSGIGYLMVSAASRFDVPLVFAGLLVTSIMGVGMYGVAAVIEQRTVGWAMRSTGAQVQ